MTTLGYILIESNAEECEEKTEAEIIPLRSILECLQIREDDKRYLHINYSRLGTWNWKQINIGDFVTLVSGGNKACYSCQILNISQILVDIAEYAFNERGAR